MAGCGSPKLHKKQTSLKALNPSRQEGAERIQVTQVGSKISIGSSDKERGDVDRPANWFRLEAR